MADQARPDGFRSGYVAIVGKPNVGKSTLLNRLLGRKLSIVTRKAQTTRHRILGLLTDDETQIVFLDTPGVIEPRYRLHAAMMRAVAVAVSDADIVLFLADARDSVPDALSLRKATVKPMILVLNKMDLIRREDALPLAERYLAEQAFEAVVPISAHTGYNLEALMNEIRRLLPEGPAYYSADTISEHPERFFVSEIIREKVFRNFRQEVPYSACVNITTYRESDSGKDYIEADIVVERESQKAILIGKKGHTLKRVGIDARKDIEDFTGRSVYLKLFVKVRADWRNRTTFLRSYGYLD